MPVLELRRAHPLSTLETARLPDGCVAVRGQGDLVARATVKLPLSGLLALAVEMGRAVPDARFEVLDGAPEVDAGRKVSAPDAAETVDAPAETGEALATGAESRDERDDGAAGDGADRDEGPGSGGATSGDPWEEVGGGRFANAEALLRGRTLGSTGRDQVRRLLGSTDPEEIAAGCRIARITEWRSSVSMVRRHLRHADTRVRRDAVEAVGALAGPALVPALEALAADPSPEVRAAALAAIARIEGAEEG